MQPSLRSVSSMSSVAPIDTELVVMHLSATIGLGITVVGQTIQKEDYGIYVGTVKPGGAAANSGRINTGDWLLEVNGLDVAKMSNDVALKVIRMEAAKGGTMLLLISKFWKPHVPASGRRSKENNASYVNHRRYPTKRKTPQKKIVSSTPSLPPRQVVDTSRRRTTGGILSEHRNASSVLSRPERQHLQASGRSSGEVNTIYHSLLPQTVQSVIHENPEPLPGYYNVPMMNFYENEIIQVSDGLLIN